MNKTNSQRCALLGGPPVRPEGPPSWPLADPEIGATAASIFADGSWGRYHGPHCDALAEEIRATQEVEHVLLCASGTAAVELALRGVGVQPEDEVLLAAYDFKGNFQNVLAVGAVPVLVDVDERNWHLDVELLDAAVTERTRAVIVSHLHGGSAAMRAVTEIASRHGLAVIEDACQMPGAQVEGRTAGAWGDVGVWSFGGSKLLTAGRGGCLFTNDASIAQRTRLYRERGNDAYPLSEMQAAVLLPQLRKLHAHNRLRAENVKRFKEILESVAGLVPFESEADDSEPGFYKLGLKYEPHAFGGLTREIFAAAARAEGIALDAGFRALHRIHSRRRFQAPHALTHAERADEQCLVLHHPVLLEGEAEIAQIVEAIEKIRENAGRLLAAQ